VDSLPAAGSRRPKPISPASCRWPTNICAEADSGGHTDQRPLVTLLPDLVRRRDQVEREQGYPGAVRIGVAGGLGTPEAVPRRWCSARTSS